MQYFYKTRVDDLQSHLSPDTSPDNLYVDIKVANIGEVRNVPMTFNQRKTEPIIDNPSDYYLTVARFNLPDFDFPILIMPIINNQADPNKSQYSITLETATDIQPVNLFYAARNSNPVPKDAIPTQRFTRYYFIYEYQHMVDMVNTALLLAFDRLGGKPVGAVAPFMTFDPVTDLFSIVAQESQYGVTIEPTPLPPADPTIPPTFAADIKIWMNFKLFVLFNGLAVNTPVGTIAPDGRDDQILVTGGFFQIPNTSPIFPPTLIEVLQQYRSTSSWSPVKQIIFTTNLIPTQSEYTSLSGNSFQKILTDFEPLKNSSQIRQTLQYFPQGPYRLIDLIGTNPLYNIDLTVSWLDVFGTSYIGGINAFAEMTVKYLFVKRSLYKNKNLIYK